MPVCFPWKGSKLNVKFQQKILVIGSFSPKISALAFKSCQSNPSAYKCQHRAIVSFLLSSLGTTSLLVAFFSALINWQKPADPRTALHKPPSEVSFCCLYAAEQRTLISTESNLSTSPHLCGRSLRRRFVSRGRCCEESLQPSKHQE